MASDTVPPSGSRLIAGRYQLGESLGQGGMGGVWVADDLTLHRKVAVKLLNSAMADKTKVKERFKAEARAAAKLNHPNVVAVYDTGEHDGIPFIVMELLSGETLADEIEAGPMDEQRVLSLAAQTLAGLRAAHEVGIVHRDIKPPNILFTDGRKSVKVADFGIAKGTEGMNLTQTGSVMGTPAYLAPEQVAGEPSTFASDLYSLGVVMYEALAGRSPHEGDSVIALANKIYNEEPPPLSEVRPGIDARIAALVGKAMAKDPGERFVSAREMGETVTELMSPVHPSRQLRDDRTMVAPAAIGSSDRTQVLAAARTAETAGPAAVRRRLSQPVRVAIALSVAALLLIIGVIAWQSLTLPGPSRPTPSPTVEVTGGSPLPAPLERSLRRLEEAVRP